jgi:hypothetical protein
LAFAGQRLFGLDGLALALAVTTGAVLAALLTGLGAFGPTARGLGLAALIVAGATALAYAPTALLLPAVAAAAFGLVVYAALFAAVRPAGFLSAWRYLRALG